ncbi:MAG: radical SAM protein [Candidatus Latescibacteria bacterium]|nr:radical SAM protein [Candidatus Latescibacterota bacterium]
MNIGYQKFSVNGSRYLYDTTTNAIVKISETVYRILDDYLIHDAEYILKNYTVDISYEDLREALEWLKNAINLCCMLQPFFPKDFKTILNKSYIKSALASGIRQMALNITEQCNLRCSYCIYSGIYLSERTHNNFTMTWDIARRSIDYFVTHRKKGHKGNIAFYGGEPLIKWNLVKKCIKYIRNYCDPDQLDMNIITNGTLLNKEIIQTLVDLEVNLYISLDGPRDVHDEYRKYKTGEGTYDHLIKTVKMIKVNFPQYYQKRIIFNGTFHIKNDILEIADFANQGLFSNIPFRLNTIKTTDTDVKLFTEKEYKEHHKRLDILLDRYLESLFNDNDFPYGLIHHVFGNVFTTLSTRQVGFSNNCGAPRGICVPGTVRLFVSSDGTFHVCEKFCPPGYDIGNCKIGIDVDKVRNLLEEVVSMSEELCQKCWAYRLCSHCFIHVLDRGKITIDQKRKNCERTKQKLLKSLERFVYLWERENPDAVNNPNTLHAHVLNNRK